jgi:DNA polymerase family B, exonuclease domain
MSPIKRLIYNDNDNEDNDLLRISPKRLRGGGFEENHEFINDDNDYLEDPQMLLENDVVNDYEEYIPNDVEEEAVQKYTTTTDLNRWKRPDLSRDFCNDHDIDFLWIEMDVVNGKPLDRNPNINRNDIVGYSGNCVPILRAYGVTDVGHSVTAFIHGFTPYGYFAIPPGYTFLDSTRNRNAIREELNTLLLKENASKNLTVAVLGVNYEENKQSMLGYETPDRKFLHIFVALPGLIPALKRILESGLKLQGIVQESSVQNGNNSTSNHAEFAAFECHVPFVLRFMVDRSLSGAGWLSLPGKTYQIRSKSEKETHCQVSTLVYIVHVIPHANITNPCLCV